MIKITLIEYDGDEHVLDVESGLSVMNAAVDNLIPGIDADCGGECNCATCHVYVDETWMPKVGPASDAEEAMIGLNPDRRETSRLSCQIKLTEELDGLVVRMPEFQY
ncbi:MAG: 2Fe-2S iron-sulfur cluster binding domain-containing protein [Gammaproteobacteria bacterium]|nr:2Fe-2S iron-sulfur cluster binding domain-containing protein [Gammaproteobacteria bacterium]